MKERQLNSKIPVAAGVERLHKIDELRKPRRRWITYLPVVFLAISLAAPLVRAQGEASISGKVTDATGSAIPHASVKIISVEKGSVRRTGTDEAGNFYAPLLSVGKYRVTAEKEGFATVEQDVTLVLGQRADLELTLAVAGIHQAIQVEAAAFAGDVSTADVSGLVSERQVKDLPLNGRSYDQLLTLNPGVINYTSQRSGGTGTSNSVVGNMFAVSGRRPQENLYLLNGVEFTSASEVNNTPGGTSGQLLGVDAVQEFALVKDTYGAEYGKRPGAQINIVTASGSNQVHGNVYEFIRNSALDARNFFDFGSIPNFQRNEFGGSPGYRCAVPRFPVARWRRRGKCRLRRAGRSVVDRKSTRLNSSHLGISYAVFCLRKKTTKTAATPACPASPPTALWHGWPSYL